MLDDELLVRWITTSELRSLATQAFETPAPSSFAPLLRKPQDEEIFLMPSKIYLILKACERMENAKDERLQADRASFETRALHAPQDEVNL